MLSRDLFAVANLLVASVLGPRFCSRPRRESRWDDMTAIWNRVCCVTNSSVRRQILSAVLRRRLIFSLLIDIHAATCTMSIRYSDTSSSEPNQGEENAENSVPALFDRGTHSVFLKYNLVRLRLKRQWQLFLNCPQFTYFWHDNLP